MMFITPLHLVKVTVRLGFSRTITHFRDLPRDMFCPGFFSFCDLLLEIAANFFLVDNCIGDFCQTNYLNIYRTDLCLQG